MGVGRVHAGLINAAAIASLTAGSDFDGAW